MKKYVIYSPSINKLMIIIGAEYSMILGNWVLIGEL